MNLLVAIVITLFWDANSEPDLAGYNVYQGGASHTYTNKVAVGNTTTNHLDPAPGKYFFAVTALNTNGAESDFSNEVTVDVQAAEPVLEITAAKFLAIGLSWSALGGAAYQVESSGELGTNWTARSPEMTMATDSTMKWAEACDEPDRFYRVVRLR